MCITFARSLFYSVIFAPRLCLSTRCPRLILKLSPRYGQGRGKGQGLFLIMGAKPPYPHEKTKWGSICLMENWLSTSRAGLADFSVPPFGCGRAPIPPLLGHGNGIVRKESACGGHMMNRKQGSAGKKYASMCLLANWLSAARAGLEDFSAPPFGCGQALIPPLL